MSRPRKEIRPPGRPTPRRAFKVVSAGCIVYRAESPGLQVLLGRRQGSDWMLPRGKALPGERPREAAVREVFEETGVRVRATLEVGSYSYPIGKGRYKMVHLYAATVVSGTPKPDGEEFTELRWVDLSDALEGLAPRDSVHVAALADLFEKRVLT